MTQTQTAALNVITNRYCPLTMQEIGREAGLTGRRAQDAVAALIDQGLVKREWDHDGLPFYFLASRQNESLTFLETRFTNATRTFTRVDGTFRHTVTAYYDAAHCWRWVTNRNAVQVKDAQLYGMCPDPVAQQAGVDADLAQLVADMNRQPRRQRTAEELHEMRAAFGEGAVVVNVFTGQVTQL